MTFDGLLLFREGRRDFHELRASFLSTRGLGQSLPPVAATRTRPAQGRQLSIGLVALLSFLQPLSAYGDIIVGIAAPTNGQGAEIRRAAHAFAKRINAEGGVLGQRIAVIEADDGCNADQGAKAAQSLVKRRATLVIGHPCASAARAADHIYASNSVILMGMTRHPTLTDKRAGKTIFRVVGRDDREGATAAAYLARHFADRPIAILRDPSRYAGRIASDVRAALNSAGFTSLFSAAVGGGQKDYAKLIAKLKEAETEAVFFAGFPLEAGLLLRQMRAAGVEAAFIGSESLAASQFADAAGPAISGARVLLSHDPARDLVTPHLSKPSEIRPTGPYLMTVAAIEAWRAAASEAGTTAPNAVSAALNVSTFETVLGSVSFSEIGDANRPAYDVVGWNGDEWRLVGRER